ncbi:NAD(P)-dependent oxidoreductase [Pseudomonas sp. 008]|jgi:3-hydroxyisobutyrate dehydrogenase|uniref:NAD(P)-dependent oxidoreductase n=1 Tax=Pseudomonas sp. 008 TaxID=2803906 RepID=UPI00194F7A2F|nr:NAD(P)-dependent oxidoreductase [Pseudomonas sp. 008]GID03027.1 2-hydroxy-3-oxopropionate reductase [Pseudomonas sp. 008]
MSSITIGMVGLGQLGLPIATNLLKAGFRVVGYRRRDREAFTQLGGIAVSSPAEVAAEADFILLCLPGEAAELEVMDGPNGLFNALRPEHTLIEMGTYKRAFKEQLAKRIESKGAEILEAEISGSPPMVLARKASIFLGGDEQLIEHCQPVLSAIADIQFRIGEFGSAVAMKLIANYLLTIHTLAAAEALNLGVRAGFSADKVVEVIRQSAGGSTMFSIRAPMMASRTFKPAPGALVTLEKYLQMAGELSDDLGCASPLFSVAESYFLRALDMGMGEEDISAVIRLIESDSSVLPQEE